ncbi:sulfatase-like hydrolase/transferase [Pseudomonas sichuanensis]|uniref:sulfatase-like hydrolase/transferase n=1 Tax=Pseudomonas sichuanensis TaxID=2213015 RepID=UPI002160F3EF|nr:sulfatase-like hydrolase/transferase [Pseudomonas sichuanensis]UVK82076.1 sulfatase-like hydrolase/transferase [Pseudomonas sichuanensis]
MERRNHLLEVALLFAVALLLVPKIILISYFSNRWIDTDLASIALYLLQDLLLAGLVYLVAVTTLRRHRYNFFLVSILCGALLLFLLVDMRVRELWLKPLDWSLIQYSLENASNLRSGAPVFLNQLAGFGLTFRFIVFVLFLAYLAAWGLVGLATYQAFKRPPAAPARARTLGVVVLLCGLLLGAIFAKDARYDLNENIVTRSLVSALQNATQVNASLHPNLLPFEQPAYPVSAITTLPKLDSAPAADFKNLVYIVMESVRWNSIFGAEVNTAQRYPTFDRLAREGMLFKSYVTVPHSSKGYYSIFTGQHAYPGVEIKEAMPLHQPGVIHELQQKNNMQAVAFSSLFLQFENMDGFLKSIGVANAYAVADIAPANTLAQNNSSFGASDELLYTSSIPHLQAISKTGKGFIALYFPSAAHYPYDCTGTSASQSALEKYETCIETTDTLIGQMLEGYDKAGLLDSTLFVLVGDHGESFGEHGLFIHNSSMHEEEVTVPLIFWAKGKTLAKPISTTSQQTDIAPTIADFFAVADAPFNVQGISLLRDHGKRVFYMSTFFDQLSSALVEHPYKYIYEYSPDTLVRYHLEDDPQEKNPQPVEGDAFTTLKNRLLSYDAYQKALFAKDPKPGE